MQENDVANLKLKVYSPRFSLFMSYLLQNIRMQNQTQLSIKLGGFFFKLNLSFRVTDDSGKFQHHHSSINNYRIFDKFLMFKICSKFKTSTCWSGPKINNASFYQPKYMDILSVKVLNIFLIFWKTSLLSCGQWFWEVWERIFTRPLW